MARRREKRTVRGEGLKMDVIDSENGCGSLVVMFSR